MFGLRTCLCGIHVCGDSVYVSCSSGPSGQRAYSRTEFVLNAEVNFP